MSLSVPNIKFNNGNVIPAFGLGTWKSKPGEVTEAVKYAIDIGYRHFDCAYVYGNQKEIGIAIKDKIAEGVIKREDLFITSKLWNTFHKRNAVESHLQSTLDELGLEYLDLYLIHWPIAFKEGSELFPTDSDGTLQLDNDADYVETWKGMESVLAKYLTVNIGVSNFNSEQIDRIINCCDVKPVTNQVESHPYLNQEKLSEFCRKRGIVITAYSPFGSPDRPWAKPDDPKLLEDKKLLELSKKYNKTPAQILVRYQLDQGCVVIPKSVTKSRILENSQVFDFKLSEADITYVKDSFNCNGRICAMEGSIASAYYPFSIPF
ncbi:PREDICTED: aldose reductase-like [Ceratosolen solmsi marchali]|uniref:Aldose reductase-like n=1 Tax=Ceratosolen solmsi marchali TaxID=326594 RepID=A0AAJ6YM22_9HYME|nr:PREDICTED: aldose reductase-like [Ceratosolen solmsi marchali]